MPHYKIKLVKNISHRETWVPIQADDTRQAQIAATLKCTKTEFIPDYTSLQVIDWPEFNSLEQVVFVK
jgi:hypothetical protein